MSRTVNISVVGGAAVDAKTASLAREVGRLVALKGWTLVCGGLGGVMEAVSRGARENGGTVVGILPGYEHSDANEFVSIVIPTGLGHARNAVVAASADGMIAIGGSHGTLSEIAFGIKMGKPVVGLATSLIVDGMLSAETPDEAIGMLEAVLKGRFA